MSWIREQFTFHDLQRLLVKLAEHVKAFQGLAPAEIGELLARAEKCSYEENVPIVREGSSGNHMYIILDGVAVVSKKGSRRRDRAGPPVFGRQLRRDGAGGQRGTQRNGHGADALRAGAAVGSGAQRPPGNRHERSIATSPGCCPRACAPPTRRWPGGC